MIDCPSFDASLFSASLGQIVDVYYSVLSYFRVTWLPYVLQSAALVIGFTQQTKITIIHVFYHTSLVCFIFI